MYTAEAAPTRPDHRASDCGRHHTYGGGRKLEGSDSTLTARGTQADSRRHSVFLGLPVDAQATDAPGLVCCKHQELLDFEFWQNQVKHGEQGVLP